MVHRISEEIADSKEFRFFIANHAAIWRNADFAISESVKSINRLIAGSLRSEIHENFSSSRSVVFYTFYLDFAFLHSRKNRRDKGSGGLSVWEFGDGEGLIVDFLDFRSHFHRSATSTVVIFRHIKQTTGLKIGEELERAIVEIIDRRINDFVEVVGEDF